MVTSRLTNLLSAHQECMSMPHPSKDRTNNLKKRVSSPWFVYDVSQSAAPRRIKCTILALP